MAYTTINKQTDYFNTKVYDGTGSSNALTGVGFQPDLVSIKIKSTSGDGNVYNSLSGALKHMSTNLTNAEYTESAGAGLTAFGADGFTVGTEPAGPGSVNDGSHSYAAWCWKGNGGTGSTNTEGSIDTTVSANTTSGFSVCTMTMPSSGSFTFGHGLGVAPKMVIMKTVNASNWQVYHEGMGNTNMMQLNYNNAQSSAANWWNSTSPTSTVVSVGADFLDAGQTNIAYCFADKTGYSKCGTYVGNVSADGTFVYTGFKPAFLLVKMKNGSSHWSMFDNKRLGYNTSNRVLYTNETAAQETLGIDLLSNGFKCTTADDKVNDGQYIYLAIGQTLVGTNNTPSTAR